MLVIGKYEYACQPHIMGEYNKLEVIAYNRL